MAKRILFLPLFALLTVISMPPADVQAADKALIFGVAEYQDSGIPNLPGNKYDIEMMTDVVKKLGFRPENTKVLFNEQATKKNIEDAVRSWLAGGLSPEDRVLIYYTGHGTQIADRNGDEDDMLDEAIIPYDADWTAGMDDTLLSDDDLEQLFAKIPSQKVFIIFDSCHSGTATKSLGLTAKFSPWPGVQREKNNNKATVRVNRAVVRVDTDPGWKENGENNVILLAACRDDEVSLSNRQEGSLFTQGLLQTVNRANGHLTLEDLRAGAAEFIKENVNVVQLFRPQIAESDSSLAHVNLISQSSLPLNSLWEKLIGYADHFAAKKLRITADKQIYQVNDLLTLKVKVPAEGYLNVLNIGKRDTQPTILFPNEYVENNKVKRGTFTLPGDAGDFEMPALAADKVLIVAFFTRKPLNLYKDGGEKYANGFKLLSKMGESSLRAFGVEAPTSQASGRIFVEIVP